MTLNKPSGWEDWINTVQCMDCLKGMGQMPEGVVHCVVTSPPYYGLRDYGTAKWEGGEADCDHKAPDEAGQTEKPTVGQRTHAGRFAGSTCWKCGATRTDPQLGLEKTPEEYIAKMVEVFREVKRIMHPTGCLWLNMGDSYCGSWGDSGHRPERTGTPGHQRDKTTEWFKREGHAGAIKANLPGLKPKDLLEMPSRLVLALQADGWWLRSRIPWLKRNAMPESCTDRPTQAVEYVFLLSKSKDYYYDGEAVRVPAARIDTQTFGGAKARRNKIKKGDPRYRGGHEQWGRTVTTGEGGRSRRNSDWFFESWQGLWTDENGEPLAFIVNPKPYKQAHFATFPPGLVIPCLKAGTSERGACPECGSPWVRVVEKSGGRDWHQDKMESKGIPGEISGEAGNKRGQSKNPLNEIQQTKTLGWRATCSCSKEPVPCLAFDPFSGTGTVIQVARKMGSSGLGFEISEEYVKDFCKERLAQGVLGLTPE